MLISAIRDQSQTVVQLDKFLVVVHFLLFTGLIGLNFCSKQICDTLEVETGDQAQTQKLSGGIISHDLTDEILPGC